MPSKGRILYIDALRGLAILCSLNQHLGLWLFQQYEDLSEYPLLFAINLTGGLAGPLFVVLAGVGVSLATEREVSASTLNRRGLLILAYGYLLNVITPSWFSFSSWFVLHLIGFGVLCSPVFLKLPTRVLYLFSFVAVAISVAGQVYLETPVELLWEQMNDTSRPGGALRLAFFEGHFPVFPWIAFFLNGIVVGRQLRTGEPRNLLRFAISLFCAAGALVALRTSLNYFAPGSVLTESGIGKRFFSLYFMFYPTTVFFFIVLLALSIVALLMFRTWEGRGGGSEKNLLIVLGRCSLTIYVTHIAIGRFLFSHYWLSNCGPFMLLPVIGAVMIMFAYLATIWARYDYRYGFEWLLRKV